MVLFTYWRRAKMARASLMAGVLLACLVAAVGPMLTQYAGVRADTLRLHILANSDSEADQALKLAVRDAILAAEGPLFGQADTQEEALAAARAALPLIEQTARAEIARRGYDYPVTAKVENLYFATKDYDAFTLPAGRYDAVRVEIGEHKGRNWFCVLFPPLCVPAALDADDGPSYDEDEDAAVKTPYKIKFAAVEAVERVREWMRAD